MKLLKKTMKSKRDQKEDRDRLSDLHDSVLLHIMKFMNTKQAVQTCVLSTRWKDLWRHVTNLALNLSDISPNRHNFTKFVDSVLCHRDNSISLHDVVLKHDFIESEVVHRVVTYAVSHNVENLTLEIEIDFNSRSSYNFPPCIFSCKSMTHLKISLTDFSSKTKLPSTLQLPALKCLHLMNVTFAANANGIADPFSNCNMLNTLVLQYCSLHHNASVLSISNSKLSSLTIGRTTPKERVKVVVSSPELNSITLMRDSIHQVYVCDLSFLEQANIDVWDRRFLEQVNIELTYSSIISWLHAIANYVKILELSSSTLKVLLHPTSGSIRSKLPCFVRLMSLKLKLKVKPTNIPADPEEVRKLVLLFRKKYPRVKMHIDF